MYLSLYEIETSYRTSQGVWRAYDDYEHRGYSEKKQKETLRGVAPSEDLARACVLDSRRHWGAEPEFTIDKITRHNLEAIVEVRS